MIFWRGCASRRRNPVASRQAEAESRTAVALTFAFCVDIDPADVEARSPQASRFLLAADAVVVGVKAVDVGASDVHRALHVPGTVA